MVRQTTAGSSVIYTYVYDDFGRMVKRTATDQDWQVTVTTFNYAAPGSARPGQITLAPGTAPETAVSYRYDANGNLVRITGPGDSLTTYAYDELNRPIQITEAAGTADERSTGFLYFDYGKQIVVVDPLGALTQFDYDAAGRLIRVDAPLTSYSYDSAGRLTRRTDANGATNTFAYDVFNHLTRIDLADGSNLLYTYDVLGNRISMTDSRGATTYSYDPRNRLEADRRPMEPHCSSATISTVTGYL